MYDPIHALYIDWTNAEIEREIRMEVKCENPDPELISTLLSILDSRKLSPLRGE